ncbi:MAG: UDP-N-acetylmuramoyl-L-alanine--D-glutamate ligase [Pseudomonadota bacterium]|nr:UDP-N-acetylmuramoyl-L-alanine--D-glutamate ligase [Pseudomonadota bacterium]
MITAKAFADKHYAVYGLARSGLATVEALLASGARVTAWDGKEEARDAAPAGASVADLDSADLSGFDSLVVTPGLPLNRHPIAERARAAGVEIIGDIELFARARPELPPHKVVGITGTNGKSTTTALVHHILNTAGVPATMGGNIGLPILAQDPLPEGGVYVLELSSYQIDLTRTLDCEVAVLLNVTPDHLERYESFEAYERSKWRLFQMQNEGLHLAVVTEPCPVREEFNAGVPNVNIAWIDADTVFDRQRHWPALQGPHNAQNAACAITVLRELKLGDAAVEAGLRTFPGLAHRMERVADKDGVLFVNDSKATNSTATAPAIAVFSSIRWILGGQAKSDNLDECAPHFGNVRSAYTIGEAAELFERLLSPHMPVKNCGKLEAAVKAAAADAQAGDTVLLSPACASFDQFRDFEDRGDTFKNLVGALK